MTQETPSHRKQAVQPRKADSTNTEPLKPEEKKLSGKAKKQPVEEN